MKYIKFYNFVQWKSLQECDINYLNFSIFSNSFFKYNFVTIR